MADVLKLKTAPGQAWHSVPALVGPPGDVESALAALWGTCYEYSK